MDIAGLMLILVPPVLTIAAYVWRRRLLLRMLAVLASVFIGVGVLTFGLGKAARNAERPAMETMQSQARYGDAWMDGARATQNAVDYPRRWLALYFGCMAALALLPIVGGAKRSKREEEGNKEVSAPG